MVSLPSTVPVLVYMGLVTGFTRIDLPNINVITKGLSVYLD